MVWRRKYSRFGEATHRLAAVVVLALGVAPAPAQPAPAGGDTETVWVPAAQSAPPTRPAPAAPAAPAAPTAPAVPAAEPPTHLPAVPAPVPPVPPLPPARPSGEPLPPPKRLPDLPPLQLPDIPTLPEPGVPQLDLPQPAVYHPRAESRLLSLARAVHDCLTYPDPCYEPRFVPAASAAFFTEPLRPVNQMRIGYDAVRDFRQPDRAEFFWARADGRGKGPAPINGRAVPALDYDRLLLITEAAAGKASIVVTTPYQSVEPVYGRGGSGFGDITIGAKSVLFDTELFQVGFLFNTHVLSGNFRKGLGTGHVSLEPSLLFGLKLTNDAYVQAQLSEWIPIGGDAQYQGSILHSHLALNYVVARIAPDAPIVANVEVNTYSFQDGAFTGPDLTAHPASGRTFVSLGPGLRTYVTNKFDIGFAASFAATNFALPQQFYRFEMRFRF
jgi:hypothetical protein